MKENHITIEMLDEKIKKGEIEGSYIIYGIDEKQIKEVIDKIEKKFIDPSMVDLNSMKIDGADFNIDSIINTCEAIPFISEKKLVVLYRAEILRIKKGEKPSNSYKELIAYMKDMPPHTIFIAYYVFEDKREKNSTLDSLKSNITVVKVEELKGDRLYKKVSEVFSRKGKTIGKIELKFFCDSVDNDLNIIENEVDKLLSYTEGREIKKEDIVILLPTKKDDDIFDLVEAMSTNKTQKALQIASELMFKGERETKILSMIERQFDLLLKAIVSIKNRKSNDEFAKEYGLHPYVAKNLMIQSSKFSEKSIKECLNICGSGEKNMKSTGGDNKLELEMIIIKCAMASKIK